MVSLLKSFKNLKKNAFKYESLTTKFEEFQADQMSSHLDKERRGT